MALPAVTGLLELLMLSSGFRTAARLVENVKIPGAAVCTEVLKGAELVLPILTTTVAVPTLTSFGIWKLI